MIVPGASAVLLLPALAQFLFWNGTLTELLWHLNDNAGPIAATCANMDPDRNPANTSAASTVILPEEFKREYEVLHGFRESFQRHDDAEDEVVLRLALTIFAESPRACDSPKLNPLNHAQVPGWRRNGS
jgi:hypothetical protein